MIHRRILIQNPICLVICINTSTLKIVIRNIAQFAILLVILIGLSYLSFQLSTVTNSLLLYLPLVLGIVFIHWFGLKVVPVLLINGITTLMIYGVTKFPPFMIMISTHEAVVAVTSWLLYQKLFPQKHSERLGNTESFLRFLFLGIVIPVCVNSIYVYHYGFVKGDMDKVGLYWLSDFITILPLSIALLYFIDFKTDTQSFQFKPLQISRRAFIELLGISGVFIALSILFPFDKYWFIYGIGATLFALRWGFSVAIVLNVIIFMLSYLLPLFDFASSLLITQGSTQFISVHLGMSTMMFVSLLVGRVVTDLSTAEQNLKTEKARVEKINDNLQQANQELDHFVYSVSHDLSAPLKSIKGLVTVSRMDPTNGSLYLEKIEKSVERLENFIDEVLEYSRTSRKNLVYESIQIKELVDQINAKFEFLENYANIHFSYDLQVPVITSDRFLLRVALGNLLSNAIKYQKKFSDQEPQIILKSYQDASSLILEVIDNGEGIRDEFKTKLFNMFYRGTASSTGSGLGLYIAKEAVQKLGGTISVESVYGEGSTFRIKLPAGQL